MTRPLLSLVIPCYDEAASLPALLSRLGETLGPLRGEAEAILVDNGSTDGTAVLLAGLPKGDEWLRSVRVPVNQGYGHGILRGLEDARGEWLGWTHADLQTDPADILPALDWVMENPGRAAFLKGRRQGRPWADAFFTTGMGMFESLLFNVPLWDINAQPTVFPRGFYGTWNRPPKDFSLDLYAYAMARRHGLPVRRFPVRFGPRAHGESHWNSGWRQRWKFIRRTWDYSWALKAGRDTE